MHCIPSPIPMKSVQTHADLSHLILAFHSIVQQSTAEPNPQRTLRFAVSFVHGAVVLVHTALGGARHRRYLSTSEMDASLELLLR